MKKHLIMTAGLALLLLMPLGRVEAAVQPSVVFDTSSRMLYPTNLNATFATLTVGTLVFSNGVPWAQITETPQTLSGYGITNAARADDLASHIDATDNPHGVTAEQVGAPTISEFGALETTVTNHVANTSNPHSVTADQVGLGNVENTALSTWAGSGNLATLGTVTQGTWQATPIARQYLAALPGEVGVACSDETTAITTGAGKVTFRMPFALTLTAVRASLTTAQASGSTFTVNVKENGDSIFSTKVTIDNGEKTSTTAATAAVISDAALADDAEITVDVDQIGDGTATGLKLWLIGTR